MKEELIKLVKTIGFTDLSDGKFASSRSSASFSSSTVGDGVLNISSVSPGESDLGPGIIAMTKAVLAAGLYPQVRLLLGF